MSETLDRAVEALLNGKMPNGYFLTAKGSYQLAEALASKIDSGVAPSRCAHAMCGSSAAGNVAVVKMLSSRPMTTFNKAYSFGEPLRRSCRAFVRTSDSQKQKDLAECSKLIVAAHGDLNQPDKYLKSGLSAAESLRAAGTEEALKLLDELLEIATITHTVPTLEATSLSKKRKSLDETSSPTDVYTAVTKYKRRK